MKKIRFETEIFRAEKDSLKETYEGAYEITPRVIEQTFETENKYMEKDLTVLAIPYCEVSNQSGTTVIIGGV